MSVFFIGLPSLFILVRRFSIGRSKLSPFPIYNPPTCLFGQTLDQLPKIPPSGHHPCPFSPPSSGSHPPTHPPAVTLSIGILPDPKSSQPISVQALRFSCLTRSLGKELPCNSTSASRNMSCSISHARDPGASRSFLPKTSRARQPPLLLPRGARTSPCLLDLPS